MKRRKNSIFFPFETVREGKEAPGIDHRSVPLLLSSEENVGRTLKRCERSRKRWGKIRSLFVCIKLFVWEDETQMASNLSFPNLHENRTARSRSTASSASAGAVSLAPVKLVGGLLWSCGVLKASDLLYHVSFQFSRIPISLSLSPRLRSDRSGFSSRASNTPPLKV